MKSSTIKAFTAAHSWMGLITGMALFVAFLAGSLTLFHKEIGNWQLPQREFVPLQEADAIQLAHLQSLIDEVQAREITADRDRLLIWLAGAHGAQPYVQWRASDTREPQALYTLDGAVLNPEDPSHSRMADFLNQLHFTLGLPKSFGEYLMGLVSLLYGIALLSGLVIHSPQLLKNLFALRPGRNRKRFWQDLHNIIGVLSLPFHLMYAFTGVFFTLAIALFAGMNYLVMDNTIAAFLKDFNRVVPSVESSGEAAPMVPLQQLLHAAESEIPGLEPGLLVWEHYGDTAATVTVHGYAPRSLRARSAVVLSGANASVLGVNAPNNSTPTLHASGLITALHLGEFGGIIVRWIYFGLGLAGCVLFYTGNLLWIESRRRRIGTQRWDTVWMAKITVGICLGSIFAVAVMFLSNLLLPIGLDHRADWEVACFYFSWAAAILWASRAPPSKAAPGLLYAASATSGLFCVGALLGGGEISGPALTIAWVGLFATVLLFGLAFSARQRAMEHRRTSAWSATTNSIDKA